MNPKHFLLVIASMAILNSCTKETVNPLSEEPLPGSVIELFYEEETINLETNNNSRFIHIPPPPSIEQDCKSTIPNVIVPKMHDNTVEFVYARNSNYTGNGATKIKALKWVVNGKEQLNFSTTLKLPYAVNDDFDIELTVTFTDGSTQKTSFVFETSPNLQTLGDGTIRYSTGVDAFSGRTIGQSCPDQFGRAVSIIIIDIVI